MNRCASSAGAAARGAGGIAPLQRALARTNGNDARTQMALAFCYKWQVASTIIGVTSVAQLEEDLNAWGYVVARGAEGHRCDPLGAARPALS